MKRIKNSAGYGVEGWVEVDELGRIVIGQLGIKIYGKKQDIIDEGFLKEEVAKAVIYVDVPSKIKNI